jgi:hypothetical protein
MPKNDDPTEIEPRPVPVPLTPTANVAQLKSDIDSGATGDKVPMFDPALAPLGTDAEAAGTPPDPRLVAAERAQERRTAPPMGGMARLSASFPHPHRTLAILLTAANLLLLVGILAWRLSV